MSTTNNPYVFGECVFSVLKMAINPSTYTEAFSKGFNYIQKEYIAKGKMGATVTGFMLCVGTGGYLIEYMTVGSTLSNFFSSP